MRVQELDTPSVVIDMERLERNIGRIQSHSDNHGIRSRPHYKTHKIPAIAHMQIAAGAVGITCQKIGEAETLVVNGIHDITIAYNIIGHTKLERLIQLAKQAQISVTADSRFTISGLAQAAKDSKIELDVLVECDTGAGRCGVQTPKEAVSLAQDIDLSSNLRFKGLLTFKGGSPDIGYIVHTGEFFKEAVDLLGKTGLEPEVISAGGTVYLFNAWPKYSPYGVTENRPGVGVYNDRVKVEQGVATLDDCAMFVISTVVSKPTADRVILDAGSKTFSNVGARWVKNYGHVLEHPDAVLYQLSEEHGYLDISKCKPKPTIGDRLTVIPNYVNTVTNLHDHVYGCRDEVVETHWPIAGRGKTQ